ncbi:MAG: signal peptidase I [Candidatus Saccharibacteria bacterium]|nr:signal peptidase I [Candidatus Saccharibacteria bacterium]
MIKPTLRKLSSWKRQISQRNEFLGALIHIIIIMIVALVAITGFTYFILQPYQVEGGSMNPTLQSGDRILVLRLGRITSDILGSDHIPKRGEMIVFSSHLDDRKLIKRVIGLPGEEVEIRNKKIIIYNDNFPQGFEPQFNLDPPLLELSSMEPYLKRSIGQGELFVVGDNRLPKQSNDSRGEIGNIPLNQIDGTVVWRLWPLTEMGLF